jgi:hypothetical protein
MKITRIAAVLAAALMASTAMAGNDGVAVTPTIQTASYSSGNAIGGLQQVPFFRSVYLTHSGVLDAVQLMSKSGATTPITFYIFDTQPSTSTPCTDKSAFTLAAADVPLLAVQPFTLTPAATTGTTVSSAQLVQAVSVANQDGNGGTRLLYVCMVVGGTVTPPSTSDLVFKLSGALD